MYTCTDLVVSSACPGVVPNFSCGVGWHCSVVPLYLYKRERKNLIRKTVIFDWFATFKVNLL